MKRILLAGLLAWAGAAYAQPPGRGGPPNWRFVGAEPGRPGPVVKNAPFSADVTTETAQVLPDGNRIHQTSSLRLYRDSEGRTRREQSLNSLGGLTSNANLPPVVFINDPVAGVNYALSPSSRTGTRSAAGRGLGGLQHRIDVIQQANGAPGPGRRMREAAGSAGAHLKTEVLPRQTIEGVPADGLRVTEVLPAGAVGNEQPIQVVTETWRSADLQIVVLSKRSDPRYGETTTRYTNISRGEPLHTLFEVPTDYKITDAGGRATRSVSK